MQAGSFLDKVFLSKEKLLSSDNICTADEYEINFSSERLAGLMAWAL